MKIEAVDLLPVPGPKLITYGRFRDHRGYFSETFRRSDLYGIIDADFIQGNESFSVANTVRGLHFQWSPYMGKLVRTISGHMIDIVLDIRTGSPWFGMAIMVDMPAAQEYGRWIWVPPGFAHGNMFLSDTVIEYMCTGEYSPGNEAAISPLSPDIDWSMNDPVLVDMFRNLISGQGIIISDKDRVALSVSEWRKDPRSGIFTYEENI